MPLSYKSIELRNSKFRVLTDNNNHYQGMKDSKQILMWFQKQIIQIRTGGLRVLKKKTLKSIIVVLEIILYSCNMVWALPCALLIRLVSPIWKIKMGYVDSARIGHFVGDSALYLHIIRSEENLKRTTYIFYMSDKVSNLHWAKMVRRNLFVAAWVRYLIFYNRLLPNHTQYYLPHPSATGFGQFTVLGNSKANFGFLPEEEKVAKAWMRRRGWADGEPFVCLHVRDSSYLTHSPLHGGDWFYHNYRDSDIDSYTESVKYLVKQGHWVVRMGKIQHKPFTYSNKKLIDFAFSDDKNDLVDTWLSTNCRFYISTASGPVTLAAVYKVPMVFVNALPILNSFMWRDRIWVPKHLIWQESGKPFTLKDYYLHDYTIMGDYNAMKISVRDLSHCEILAAVQECEERISGNFIEDEADMSLQKLFWDVTRASPKFLEAYSSTGIHPNARAGSAWLRSQSELFFE